MIEPGAAGRPPGGAGLVQVERTRRPRGTPPARASRPRRSARGRSASRARSVWISEPSAEASRQRISSVARSIWALRLAAARWKRLTRPQAISSASSSSAVSGNRANRSDQMAPRRLGHGVGVRRLAGGRHAIRSMLRWPSSSWASWAARLVCMMCLLGSTPGRSGAGRPTDPARTARPHRRGSARETPGRGWRGPPREARQTRAEGRRVAARRQPGQGPSVAGPAATRESCTPPDRHAPSASITDAAAGRHRRRERPSRRSPAQPRPGRRSRDVPERAVFGDHRPSQTVGQPIALREIATFDRGRHDGTPWD